MSLNLPFPTTPASGSNSDPNAVWSNLDAIVAYLNSGAGGTSNPGSIAIPGTPFTLEYGWATNVPADGSAPIVFPFLNAFPNAVLIGPLVGFIAPSGAAGVWSLQPYAVTKAGFSLIASGGPLGSTLTSVSYLALGN